MAKIYGINGVITGKLGAAVYAVRNGEQISRQYQPIVANPSTPKQVEARAKMKLMSQLSAVMAPVIAIPRRGVVSSRNLFVKKNYRASGYDAGEANITLASVTLTDSVVSLPGIYAPTRVDNTDISVRLSGNQYLDVNRVVYAAFVKQSDGTLRYFGSQVSDTPGVSNVFEVTFPYTTEELVVYAYGVRDNTQAAKVIFGNLQAITAETVAKLVTSRRLLESDITLTETRAAVLAAAE